MQYATSKDGTNIAYEKSGQGPALIIVGGSLADHNFYTPLAQELAKRFTVYNFDRRGRGDSGDTHPYSVEREIEDLAALIVEAGGPVYMYGHSAGSALALRAAAAGLDITKLVLADPPYTPLDANTAEFKAQFAEQKAAIQGFHDKGDHKGAAAFFLGGFGLPAEVVEGMLQSPAGEGMINCARTLPYDYAQLGDGLVPAELAKKATAPTFILAAEATPETAQQLVAAMPDAEYKAMPASAHELDATEIAQAIVPFLEQA